MEGNVQHVVKQVSNLTARMRTTFWNGFSSSASACRSIASQYLKSYKGHSSHYTWITIRQPLAEVGMMSIIICTASSFS